MNKKYTAEAVNKACDAYIGDCLKDGLPPTNVGLALRLGCSKTSLTDWSKYSGDDADEQGKANAIKKLRLACEQWLQLQLFKGAKPASAMFLLKTLHGYNEKQELDVRHAGVLTVVTGVPKSSSGY